MAQLAETGYLRIHQIIGNPKKNIPALIPISRSQLWRNCRAGKFPKPIKLGPRVTVWSIESVKQYIASTNEAAR